MVIKSSIFFCLICGQTWNTTCQVEKYSTGFQEDPGRLVFLTAYLQTTYLQTKIVCLFSCQSLIEILAKSHLQDTILFHVHVFMATPLPTTQKMCREQG